jgi:hypothetical protein
VSWLLSRADRRSCRGARFLELADAAGDIADALTSWHPAGGGPALFALHLSSRAGREASAAQAWLLVARLLAGHPRRPGRPKLPPSPRARRARRRPAMVH